jgi:hypothetical protein
MDRLTLPIVLQHQYARPFMVRWVIFNYDGFIDARHNVIYEEIILGQREAS